MSIELKGYVQEAYAELGRKVDKGLTQNIANDIGRAWDIPRAQLEHPVAVLIGGFQGSGKTSVARALNSELKLPIISSDEIRYQLLQRGVAPSNEEFNSQVFAVRNNLISFLGREKASFVLDQMITPVRMHLVKSILGREQKIPYNILKILLIAPLETLKERVSERLPLLMIYKGTLKELEENVSKKGSFESSRFQKVFDTEKLSPDNIASEIKEMIKLLQE